VFSPTTNATTLSRITDRHIFTLFSLDGSGSRCENATKIALYVEKSMPLFYIGHVPIIIQLGLAFR
jgi:hypothetical protein